MAGSAWKWLKGFEMAGLAGIGWTWLELAGNGQKWLEMAGMAGKGRLG